MRKSEQKSMFEGIHNADLQRSAERLKQAKSYEDLSTVWISPVRGSRKCDCGLIECQRVISPGLDPKVVGCWLGLMRPMNQKFAGPFFIEGLEVGEAYENAVQMILDHPDLSKWKYILTVEEDNLPPADGLLKLYESMGKYDVVQGLYWTKGDNGQPMIYGDPKVMPKTFIPQVPIPDTVQEANGLGMGFNLFKIDMFRKIPKPWFKTMQEKGGAFSQDLFFFNNAAKYGFKFACDTRVKVGHYDAATKVVW